MLLKLFRLCAYPLSLLFTTPVRLTQTLWACRVLADGQWDGYNRFTAKHGVNSLFYWTSAINVSRYGRRGISPLVGLGNFPLSKWYFYSLPSLFAYWRMAPLLPFIGMFGWLLFHATWAETAGVWWILAVIALALISTTFYANLFVYQNYNVLGWLFLPLGLYGLMNQNWLLVSIAWLAASFGSITVVFIGGIFSLAAAAQTLSLMPLVALIPAGVKILLLQFSPLLGEHWWDGIFSIFRAIGVSRQAKYKRRVKIGIFDTYFLVLYLQFIAAYYLVTRQWSPILLIGFILAFLNSTAVLRFADQQSIQMMMMSVATAITLQSQQWWLLPSYWLLISPLPRAMGLPSSRKVFDVVPAYAPFSVKRLVNEMQKFLATVRDGQRVWMAFDNPRGAYEKVFDGYRTLLELPLYVAALRGIHFMPDWHGVFETNYEGALEFWGRGLEDVMKNIELWRPGFVVIYQPSGTLLEEKWLKNGFETIAKFSWADHLDELRGEKVYNGFTPDWWLLRPPATVENPSA